MRLAITGGTGFIGSRLALGAQDRGWEVAVGGRAGPVPEAESFRIAELRSRGIEPVAFDLGDADSLRSLFRGCDYVVHLAAAQHEMNIGDDVFDRVNIEGVRRVLATAADEGVRRVVHGSTIGVYGQGMPGTIAESMPTRPSDIYGRTKERGETLVREGVDGLETVVLRIGETYGPGDYRLIKLFRGVQSGKFPLIGTADNFHQPIFIDDLVEIVVRSLETPAAAGETMIAAGPEAITTREMAEAVAGALGIGLSARRIPMAPMLAVATVMEWTLRPLGIQPPLHRRRLDFFRKNLKFDITRLDAVLGYVPATGFEEGARRTLAWYRDKEMVQ